MDDGCVRKPCSFDVAIILGLMYTKIDSYFNCYKSYATNCSHIICDIILFSTRSLPFHFLGVFSNVNTCFFYKKIIILP